MCVITQREGAYLCIESILTRFLQKRKKGEEVVGRNGEMESGSKFSYARFHRWRSRGELVGRSAS